MTVAKFYALIRTLKSEGWRAKISQTGWIRLAGPSKTLFKSTPLTAVCSLQGKGDFHWLEDTNAGKALGLRESTVRKINAASFNTQQRGRQILKQNLGLCRNLRIIYSPNEV